MDIEFLSLDDNDLRYDEPSAFDDGEGDSDRDRDRDRDGDGAELDLETINERRGREDGDDKENHYQGSQNHHNDDVDDDDDQDDDMPDWPEDTSGSTMSHDEAVHIEGVPRSETRLEAR